MLRSRIALLAAAIILASSYLPGEAVFAKEPLTASDGVAIVAANGRYGTFESSLSLMPGNQYCYKISLSNLDSQATERYIYVALPRYFKNLPEEYIPKLVKIKDLPKPKPSKSKSGFTDDQSAKIKIEKNYEGFQFPTDNQLPTGKFTQSGSLETAELIRLDLTGLSFPKEASPHDIHFIFDAPEYESLPSGLDYGKHSFYIYERVEDSYLLTASSTQASEVRYATLSDAALASPDALETFDGEVLLQPGDFYNYCIKIKKPMRQDIENHFLLVALPAFYETAGEGSTPFLAPEAGLTVTGLNMERPPLAFSTLTERESVGDPARLSFAPASLEEYTPDVTLIKFDLSSLTFIDDEAVFDFYFQTPPNAPLDAYPTDISKKDRAVHSFALYEFNKNGDLLYKNSLEEEAKTVLIKQNPLIKALPPFLLQATDRIYYDGQTQNRASVESRRLEVLPGSRYLYRLTIDKIQSPEGFNNDMYIPLPQNVGLAANEILSEGLELEDAISTEERGIRINFNKARFTADRATLTLAFIAPASGEGSRHNFILTSNGPQGEKYIVTNQEPDLAGVTLLPPPSSEESLSAEQVSQGTGFSQEVFTDSIYENLAGQEPFLINNTAGALTTSSPVSEQEMPEISLITIPGAPEPLETWDISEQPDEAEETPTAPRDELQEKDFHKRKENPATKHEAPSIFLFLCLVLIFLYCGFEYRRRIMLSIK